MPKKELALKIYERSIEFPVLQSEKSLKIYQTIKSNGIAINRSTYRHMKAPWKLIKVVSEFHRKSNSPYLTKDVSKYESSRFNMNIPIHVIKETISKILNLSFKKGKSRKIRLDSMKQSHIKCLFAVKLVKAMNDFSILINIDETLFSRTTRPSYSWLERGKEWSIGNIWCTNSTSLITAITSTGSVYASSISDSVKESRIVDYFQGLKEFIQDKLKIDIIIN